MKLVEVDCRFDHLHQYLQVAMDEDNQQINNPSILLINFEDVLLKSLKSLVLLAYSFPTFTQEILMFVRQSQLYIPILPAKPPVFAGNRTAGKIPRFVGTLTVFVERVGRFGWLGADPSIPVW